MEETSLHQASKKAAKSVVELLENWKSESGSWDGNPSSTRRCEYDILLALWLIEEPSVKDAGQHQRKRPYFDYGEIDRDTLAGQIRFKVNTTWIKESVRHIIESLAGAVPRRRMVRNSDSAQRGVTPAQISLRSIVCSAVVYAQVEPKEEQDQNRANAKAEHKLLKKLRKEIEALERLNSHNRLKNCKRALRDLMSSRYDRTRSSPGRAEVVVNQFRERDLYPLHVSVQDWRESKAHDKTGGDGTGEGCMSPKHEQDPPDRPAALESTEGIGKKSEATRRAFSVDHSVRAHKWARNNGFIYRFYWPIKLEYFLGDLRPREARSGAESQAELGSHDRVLDEVFLTQKYNAPSKRLMVVPPLSQEVIESLETANVTVLTHADMWRFLRAFPGEYDSLHDQAPTKEEWEQLLEFPGLATCRVLEVVRARAKLPSRSSKNGNGEQHQQNGG